jgi:outer membrane lipoprotein SlyB
MENVQAKITSHPLLIIAAIAVILFCAAGVAAIMGWIPKSGADADVPAPHADAATQNQPAGAKPAKPKPLQVAAAPATSAKAVCAECGVIESVREFDKPGDVGNVGVGSVGGAVVGGVLGHQVGSGRGNDVATVVGAVGGAIAGHQIEKNMKKTKVYQVTVRFDDGSSRVISQSTAPSWRAGDRVKVQNGAIRPNA